MPKGKKKSKGGGTFRGSSRLEASLAPSSSDDESNADTASVLSCASESRCGSDGTVGDADVEEGVLHDDFEDKLKEAIDGTSQKSAKGRLSCLEAIRKALSNRYLYDFLIDRPTTVCDLVERGLRKGRGEEQGVSATLAALACVHYGAGEESAGLFQTLRQPLTTLLLDAAQAPPVRAKCATAIGLCCFVAESDNYPVVQSCMESLWQALSGAKPSTGSTPASVLHGASLLAWGLLLTVAPVDRLLALAKSSMGRLQELLESPDLDLRIAAGEVIAIIYEVARDYDDNFEEPPDALCNQLRQLATDSQKFRAKKERRQQRSTFRDVYRAVHEGTSPDITVKFGREVLELDTWSRKLQYDAFCQLLGSGMNLHLAANELLRDIFELGPVIAADDHIISKVTKFERHMVNLASCRARTKTRNRLRDKRADVYA
ncbi:interferon-related developmental regulator 1 isoform X1 [Amblyomma americanum]